MNLKDVDNTINGFFSGTHAPVGFFRTNIVEYENRYEMSCEVPGVTKEHLKVEMDNEKLSISAELTLPEFADEKYVMPLCERTTGKLQRNYRLPNVDATKIVATHKDGVLYLTLPKLDKVQSSNIQIM